MNPNEAYTACHELMLESPNYRAQEGATVTYILVQVGDLPDKISVQAQIINPALPPEGDMSKFMELTLDKQVAILSLKSVSKAIGRSHQELERILGLAQEGKNEEALERFKQLIRS
jgi:hypothetical protein